ncbi:hypothetical protein M9Y10_001151 [Tritrichomonas musculus]|uniref:Uncharacterized protein n=1 Tax=Tritrichomonas musculus TaxID=1915356 RepID=A0ABR2L685_9EUKA
METPTKNLNVEEGYYSNPRIRSFFKFDPIEFSDDVICSLSFYINNTIDTINSLLTSIEVSEKNKSIFQNELVTKLQNSIDENADKFELYIMRNIFDISVNIDLTSDIDTPKKKSDEDEKKFSDNQDDDFDDKDLDRQLAELYAQIQESQAKRVQLVTTIKTNKAKLNEVRELTKRLPDINRIIELTQQLPSDEIKKLSNTFNDLLQQVQDLANRKQSEKKLFENEKNSFEFDD